MEDLISINYLDLYSSNNLQENNNLTLFVIAGLYLRIVKKI